MARTRPNFESQSFWSSSFPRGLFYTGWAITLFYFPSGLLHAALGSGVYFRDVLLLLHLIAGVVWLVRSRELAGVVRFHWLLFVPALFILPAFVNGGARVEALTFVKWSALWADWIIIGMAGRSISGFTAGIKILLGITLLLLVADLAAGAYERSTHNFVISGEGDERTAFGVEADREHQIGDQLRVKGLQRDVFSFANLMGVSSVMGVLCFLNARNPALRVAALFWAITFAGMLAMSGGRSALFGVLGVILAASSALMAPLWTRRFYGRVVLGWLLICVAISSIGIGRLAELVGGSIFHGSAVGSSTSAFMRDDAWSGILDSIGRVPIVLIFGAPLSALFDPKVEPFYHWADNEYFWLLYHVSFLGFAAVLWYFRRALASGLPGSPTWMQDALVLSLLYVMGEAMARESLTFIGCLPLFVVVGYCEANRLGGDSPGMEDRPSTRRRRKAPVSAVSELAGRIREKAKARQ